MRNSIKTLDQLNNRLRGYTKTFRGKFLLLQKHTLTPAQFMLWDFSFTVLADWDKKNHPDTYGTFGHTCKEIGLMIGRSVSSISRNSAALFQKDLWIKESSGRTKVSGFELLDNLGTLTEEVGLIDIQQYIAGMQNPVAGTQGDTVKVNAVIPKGEGTGDKKEQQKSSIGVAVLQPVVSKDRLGFALKGNSNLPRSYEEYQKIKDTGQFDLLTIEDMIWIDLNVKEEF